MTRPRILSLLPALLLALGARTAAAQTWAAVAVGAGHTCALDTAGRAFCWGSNHHGELGARTPESCAPGHHGEHQSCWASESAAPVAVGGGKTFRAIGAGGTRSCGVDTDGKAWCWGRDVGTDRAGCANQSRCSFDPQPLAPELSFRRLRMGEGAVCGITVEGEGHCFHPPPASAGGAWEAARLAPGERLAEVDPHGHWMDRPREVVCAVTEAGAALCQGDNRFARLGTGDTLPHPGPVRVAAGARFTRVRVGDRGACGLTGVGEAYCWGVFADRPSWPGGSPPRPELFACTFSAWCGAPQPVADGVRFTELTRAHQTFCGLTPSGEVHCWRMDGVPYRVAEDARFTALEGSRHHACGLTARGEVWCWDYDGRGRPAPPFRIPGPALLP
jgi:alpha-tubulin suppressor-like RCC1 family protein